MRIAHVAPTAFGPSGLLGGGERFPLELSRALATEVECELITFGPHSGTHQEPGGLRIRTLRPFTFLHGHPAHPLAIGLPAALASADLVHTHHMRSTPSRLAALIVRMRRRRLVVTDHGLQGGDWAGLLPHLFHRFLTVSHYSALTLKAPPSQTRVIYGGADPARFAPDESADRNGVLFVGRLTPHKGIDRLIAALPTGAQLRLAGSAGHDPGLRERNYPALLRQMAVDRKVEFLGPVPDDILPSLYRQARVVAMPSVQTTCYGKEIQISELLGLVAIEAMASGTPVVCSRIGGLPEVVQDGVTGFLVEPGNVDDLRDRLSELLSDAGLAARMGRNGRELALERFTWRACAKRCLEAYRELLAGPD